MAAAANAAPLRLGAPVVVVVAGARAFAARAWPWAGPWLDGAATVNKDVELPLACAAAVGLGPDLAADLAVAAVQDLAVATGVTVAAAATMARTPEATAAIVAGVRRRLAGLPLWRGARFVLPVPSISASASVSTEIICEIVAVGPASGSVSEPFTVGLTTAVVVVAPDRVRAATPRTANPPTLSLPSVYATLRRLVVLPLQHEAVFRGAHLDPPRGTERAGPRFPVRGPYHLTCSS